MKSKDRNCVSPTPDTDFKGMLLKLGDIWDDDFQAIMDEVVAARGKANPHPELDFVKEALAEIAAEKRAKRRRRKR